jgi:hypothetical protein
VTNPDVPIERDFQDRSELSVRVYGCELGKVQLGRLFKVAAEGFEERWVSLSTTRNDTKITRGTLATLLEAVQDSAEPGDPDVVDNLVLHAWSFANRSVYIKIDTKSVWVNVEGDAKWARSMFREIERLLTETGTTKAHFYGAGKLSWNAFSLATVGDAVFSWLISSKFYHHHFPLVITMLIAFPVIMTCAGWIIGGRRDRRAQVKLNPSGPATHASWWERIGRADRIAVGILIVSVLTLAVTVVK